MFSLPPPHCTKWPIAGGPGSCELVPMAYCSRCNRTVSDARGALAQHKRNSPRHHICFKCGFDSPDRDSLTQHYISIHGYCPLCDEDYGRGAGIKDHVENEHPWCPSCSLVRGLCRIILRMAMNSQRRSLLKPSASCASTTSTGSTLNATNAEDASRASTISTSTSARTCRASTRVLCQGAPNAARHTRLSCCTSSRSRIVP